MKIFYVTRLFSGLERSFVTKEWSPEGVPTIYKFIEKIDKEHEVYFYFTAKDSGKGFFSNWTNKLDASISIKGLNNKINIISGINFYPKWLGRKLRIYLREIRQLVYITYKIFILKPDIIYCDNANVLIGGILSRIQKKIPVVFRLMGVNNSMRYTLTGREFYNMINRWAYRSPFSITICTQDGSGVEKWITRALTKKNDVRILLNGIDNKSINKNIDPKLKNLPSNKIIVMFVGKLEETKGCYEFVQSIINILNNNINNIHALIIGTGTQEKKLFEIIENQKSINYFTFIKNLPHAQIVYAHTLCDIYVSMNHFGNLSNANLEAINANDCMIIPSPQKNNGIDEVTSKLLGDAVVYVPIKQFKTLSDEISELIKSKNKREMMSKKISEIKNKFLWSWDERINAEIKILKDQIKN